jgi:hypothetical protein
MDNEENKKFKVIEENAKDAPVKDIEWEGEHLQAESTTKLQDDTGTGQQFVIRFFDFKANPEAFANHIPTGQELFNAHRTGIEAMLWTDGLVPCEVIEPRILFAKDRSHYRFVVSCIPSTGNTVIEKSDTLTDIFNVKNNASL